MPSTFDSIIDRLKEIGQIMNLKPEEVELLSKHTRISHAMLKVNKNKYPAWRIVHNDALGPGKGGIRFHPGVSEDEVKSLSFWMSIKNSLAGLPYGGGKGGVKLNPKEETKETLEKISRAYVKAFYKVLGQDIDVPAPDVYTDSQTMAWMLDEYEKKVGHHEPGMITGKPLELQGLALRSDATSRGGFIVLQELIKEINLDKKDLTVAIQGFGNAGHFIARMLSNDDYKVVAVSDSRGGILNLNGLDINKVTSVKEERNTVTEYQDAEKVDNKELLEAEVDILVLAALENQITEENARNVKAKYILELANGPVTPEADKILFNKKIMVVPDILANAGGVVVSYFEWAQNRTGNILDNDYLKNKLNEIMKDSWDKVYDLYQKRDTKIDLRTCAYVIAIKRILAAEKLRGNL